MIITWTDPAIASLKAIEDYISLDSEYYAKVVTERIINQVDKLEAFPSMGRVVPEYEKENIREVICLNYRIVYHYTKLANHDATLARKHHIPDFLPATSA